MCSKNGRQGHRAAACRSTVATVALDDDEQVAFVLCSVKTTNEVKHCEFTDLIVQQHKDTLFRGGLLSGTKSDAIHVRL